MESNVIPIRPVEYAKFDLLVCDCGNETFYLCTNHKAVCTGCRHWAIDVDLDDE
jgi:hypothetical protein